MIIQVTVGCPHNQCTFYTQGPAFQVEGRGTIMRDIDEMSSYRYCFTKAFRADGDVLVLPNEQILEIIHYIKKKNPSIERVGVYGNTKAILKKTPEELAALRQAGLGIVYQGIESGNREVLRRIKKGAFPHKQLEAAEKVKAAGMLLSQTVLLGIGGTELSEEHAIDTGSTSAQCRRTTRGRLPSCYCRTPSSTARCGGTLHSAGQVRPANELRLMIINMKVTSPCFFTSNHASTTCPYGRNFGRAAPRDSAYRRGAQETRRGC